MSKTIEVKFLPGDVAYWLDWDGEKIDREVVERVDLQPNGVEPNIQVGGLELGGFISEESSFFSTPKECAEDAISRIRKMVEDLKDE